MVTTSRIQSLYNYRHFFWSVITKEFKVRYTQSILGVSWLILEPLLLVMTLSTIFTLIGRTGPNGVPFPIFFYSAVLPWNLFKAGLVKGAGTFVKDKNLLTKIPYPREMSILKNCIVYLIEFFFASVAFFAVMLFYKYTPNIYWVYLPLLLLLISLLSMGIMFITATLNVFIRDVGILMKTLGTMWFWFTPIIFEFPYEGKTKILYYINPMVGVINGFRDIILYDRAPNFYHLWPIAIVSSVLLVIGYILFLKMERNFADVL